MSGVARMSGPTSQGPECPSWVRFGHSLLSKRAAASPRGADIQSADVIVGVGQLTIDANALQYKLLPSSSRKFNAIIDLRLRSARSSALLFILDACCAVKHRGGGHCFRAPRLGTATTRMRDIRGAAGQDLNRLTRRSIWVRSSQISGGSSNCSAVMAWKI
jgi:hypothetical protein